jgi:hypothetical protein
VSKEASNFKQDSDDNESIASEGSCIMVNDMPIVLHMLVMPNHSLANRALEEMPPNKKKLKR